MIAFDDDFRQLFKQVKEERSGRKICLSAVSEKKISNLLNEIIESDVYKRDYEQRTSTLLSDDVSYEESINGLKQIIVSLKAYGY